MCGMDACLLNEKIYTESKQNNIKNAKIYNKVAIGCL